MPYHYTQVPIESDRYYHIYNRGNNYGNVFFEEENYRFFLEKFKFYISPYTKIYAYCLLPDHFHFLLKVTDEEVIKKFKYFFISYVKSINKRYNRSGSLFLKNFKRIEINSDDYLKRLVFYINHNPEKHSYIEKYQDYKYSSFKAFLSNKSTFIDRDEVFEWFGSKKEFLEYHKYLKNLILESKLSFEE